MGQQQLLLLVLGIVIVGLAVVAGIQAFRENQRKAQIDVYTEQAVRIASNALAWKARPRATGGGQDGYAMAGLTLTQLGFSNVTNQSCGNGGCQQAQTSSGTYVTLWDPGSSYPHVAVVNANPATGQSTLEIAVFVHGSSLSCFRTRTRIRPTPADAWVEAYTPDAAYGSAPAGCANPW